MESKMNHAYGAFLGLLCGDAAGATLEFYRGKITHDVVERAMHMPGGGALSVGKGQTTDDSELAISLAYALFDKHPFDGVPFDDMASKYRLWYKSRPFDMGGTCARAFSVSVRNGDGFLAQRMARKASEGCFASEANGALMRIAPMAIWSSDQPVQVIASNAKMDALLSHPNQVCQDCNAIICIAIAYLINHAADYSGVINHVTDFVNDYVFSTARKWFLEDSLTITELDCSKNIGHVRWGFTLAIHFLRKNYTFEEAIRKTLLLGGDTDTNCAIVGAVLGALHGENGIPQYMKKSVLTFNSEHPGNGHKRPSIYNASNIAYLTYHLLSHDPVNKRNT